MNAMRMKAKNIPGNKKPGYNQKKNNFPKVPLRILGKDDRKELL